MRKINLFSLAFAAIAMLLASCVKKEENHLTPDEIFHVVHFETESSETKTTMNIEGSTVNFAWEATDYDAKLQRFHVWENENEAVRVVPTYSAGKISLDASFAGELPVSPQYVGYFNGKVPALQVPRTSTNQYDADSDVLIAESRIEEGQLLFYFKRVVAIGKLTLKDIEEGETLQSVTFELAEDSDQFLTGSLQRDNNGEDGWSWTTTGKKITLNCNITVTAGNPTPVLYFTSVPVTDGQFTVKAVTDKNTYTKEFSKTISLTRGNVKGMSMTLEKDEKEDTDGSFIIDVATFSISGNTALKVADYTSNSFNAGGYSFNSAFLTTNNANNPTSNTPANYWIQIKAKSGDFGLIKNTTEIPFKSITVYSKDANTTYGVTAGVTTTLSSLAPDKVQQNSDVQVPATGSYKNTLKSYTYDLTGMKYFQLKASSTTYLYKIEVAYSTVPPAEKLATPANLSVNADKQIVWDRVENAGSYNVYVNGGEAINVTDHYYDASSLEDGYYNVSVEAIPANSEMFVTSDKVTLANAKFGTPTLATPTPEVAKTDKTITFTWAVDAHATNGYAYTLYQGEEAVESPTTNYEVENGIATLVYSNLSPKTAYSVKVNATLVESPLRYEASEVYTTDDITTLSTINYAALQNGTYSDQTTCAAVGDPVYFTATPSTGYEFESVSVTGVEAANIERADEIFTFTMPDLDEVTVAVTFAPIGFTLSVADDIENGTVTIDDQKATYSVTDKINLTVTPAEHYDVESVYVTDNEENILEAKYNNGTEKWEVTGLHFNGVVVATFVKHNYEITISGDIEHGTVESEETANYEDEVLVQVTPSSGYKLHDGSLVADGATAHIAINATDTDGMYTFTMPGENVTINATFDAIDYTITGVAVSATCHGSVTSDKATANIGETVTFTVTPEYDWYQLKANTLKVNGTITPQRDGETNNYTFTMPASDATVTAEFEKKSYTIGDQSGSYGKLSFKVGSSTVTSAQYGDDVEIVVTPTSSDYELTPGTLKAYRRGNTSDLLPLTGTIFTMKNFDVSVSAEFRKRTFTFTKDGSSNLTFDIQNTDGTSIAETGSVSGQTIKLVASGVNGGKQAKWTVTSTSGAVATSPVAGNANAVTFTMPASNVTIKCEEGDASTTITFDATSDKPSSGKTYTKDGITITVTDGDVSNGTDYRVYKNQTMTISSTVGNILNIALTYSSTSNDGGGWSATYQPNATSWTSPAANGEQARITKVVVTIGSDTSQDDGQVTAGNYWKSLDITSSTESAYFTTSGNTRDFSSSESSAMNWTLKKSGSTGVSSKGFQLQASASMTMTTTGYVGGVQKITLCLSKSSNGPSFPTVTVTVDGKSFTKIGTSNQTATETEFDFTCDDGIVSATGKTISIQVTSSSSSTYVKYVKINKQ